MSSEFEYRRWAAASHDLAKRAAVIADKTRIPVIAEAWLNLADRISRAHKRAARTAIDDVAGEHPLVRSALGSDHEDRTASALADRPRTADGSSPPSN
jgi:hypothetical protein